MTTLEKRANALEPSPATERAIMLAQAANAATDGIWAEVKEFRVETRVRLDTLEETHKQFQAETRARFDTLEETHKQFQAETRARFDRVEETQRLSNTMLQLILDEMRKR